MEALHWRRVLLGGFVAEVAVMILAGPIYFLYGERSMQDAAAPASFVTSMACGWWIAHKAGRRPFAARSASDRRRAPMT